MEKKQTAVEWLITEVKKFNTIITREYMLMLFEQAKQMEKEQIIDAKNDKLYPIIVGGRQYYNETYGGEDEN
jgi:hypothetical protein